MSSTIDPNIDSPPVDPNIDSPPVDPDNPDRIPLNPNDDDFILQEMPKQPCCHEDSLHLTHMAWHFLSSCCYAGVFFLSSAMIKNITEYNTTKMTQAVDEWSAPFWTDFTWGGDGEC